jgi:hypothetical protein
MEQKAFLKQKNGFGSKQTNTLPVKRVAKIVTIKLKYF